MSVVAQEPASRVRTVAEKGASVEVDPAVPIGRYFRSGRELMRMANVYHDEQNWESAFILYSKFITIFVEKLPKHPQYKAARPEDVKGSKKNLKIAFPKAETTKKKLREKYDADYKIWQQEEVKRQEEEKRKREEEERREADKQRRLKAQEEELRRLQEEREKSIMAEQIKDLDQQRNVILREQERMRQIETEQEEREQAWQAEQERKRQLELEEQRRQTAAAAAAAGVAGLGGVATIGGVPSAPPPSYDQVNSIKSQGVRPANSAIYAPTPFANATVPDSSWSPSAPPASAPPQVDRSLKVDRSTKPAHLLSIVSSTTNKHGLRNLFVPSDIMPKFLEIAKANTAKNLETCGILAGRLSHDAFTITHSVIPKQTATSDSCTATNEEELFDVMDNNDLITLGWIHTHPTQTAFMSSIDLHTHCPYQLMMPEAIAIVCAPKHNETGMFSLTPDHGLRFIAKCTEKGFHPHPKHPAIYEEGEHCKIASNLQSQVIDLR